MQTIKSFLYLDEYKMYSISSQLFGGLTEYSTDYHGTTNEEEERQSGPFGSGKVMANILKSESRSEEKKYLHDYSYTLFERYLDEQKKVQVISADNVSAILDSTEHLAFVKVRAEAIFNDMNMLKGTIEGFNQLGEALTYVTTLEEKSDMEQQLTTLEESPTSDRNKKAELRQQLKAFRSIENLATSKGLRQDPKFLEKVAFLLNFGFQDQFEVRMLTGPYAFSANLKREYLREDEHLLVRKFSRFPEQPFVLFGTIAQTMKKRAKGEASETESTDTAAPGHMKEVIMRVVEALSVMEQSFSGKLENEIIIDPIALYSEI